MSAEKGSTPEAHRQELIDFYKQWLSDALTAGLAGVNTLVAIRDKLKLSRYEADTLRFHGIDAGIAATEAAFGQVQAAIEAEAADAADDIDQHVFKDGLFEAFIAIDDTVMPIDGVVAGQEKLLPLVDGRVYSGQIDKVVFEKPVGFSLRRPSEA